MKLKGFQRKYLKGVAHKLKPVVFIGQKGLTNEVLRALEDALDTHELIKLRFIEFKEKEQKRKICSNVEMKIECELISLVGHTAIMYRQNRDEDKRKIHIPSK